MVEDPNLEVVVLVVGVSAGVEDPGDLGAEEPEQPVVHLVVGVSAAEQGPRVEHEWLESVVGAHELRGWVRGCTAEPETFWSPLSLRSAAGLPPAGPQLMAKRSPPPQ